VRSGAEERAPSLPAHPADGPRPPRRRPARGGAAVLVAFALLALAACAVAAARATSDVATAVGLPAVNATTPLPVGGTVCRRDIDTPVAFTRVRLVVRPAGGAGPPLAISVRRDGRRVAVGRVDGGFPAGPVEAAVGAQPAGGRVDVCVRAEGAAPVVVLGSTARGAREVYDAVRGEAFAVVLLRAGPRSALAEVPEMVQRAALFKPVGPGLLWALLAAIVLGLPLLLLGALRAAGRG
jgi:hypothetical protein